MKVDGAEVHTRLAADHLQIAPSAISSQIKLLEHRFGALFQFAKPDGDRDPPSGQAVACHVQCARLARSRTNRREKG
ncbi:hypothetical protein JJB98_12375 [Bradyrhizobium diazoefficiens]|nr:hypothetical protein JJB98_12375 [Bradyrhizobium diazoefficiens]